MPLQVAANTGMLAYATSVMSCGNRLKTFEVDEQILKTR